MTSLEGLRGHSSLVVSKGSNSIYGWNFTSLQAEDPSIHPSTVTSGTSHGRKGTLLDQADFMACRWDFCLLGKPPVPCVQAALRSFHPCGLLQKINTRFAQVLSSPRAGFRPRQDSKISWHKINSAATWGKGDISINTVSNYEGRSWGRWDGSDQTHLKRKLTPDAYGIFFF